jgi:hypothetical protein
MFWYSVASAYGAAHQNIVDMVSICLEQGAAHPNICSYGINV